MMVSTTAGPDMGGLQRGRVSAGKVHEKEILFRTKCFQNRKPVRVGHSHRLP